jgi:chromosome segregation ATPase
MAARVEDRSAADILQVKITELEAEHASTLDTIAQLETQITDHQPMLATAQAQAVRNGDGKGAELAEQHQDELTRLVKRARSAETAIRADLDATRAALVEAQKAEQEARLQAIRDQARQLAVRIDAAGLDDPQGFAELKRLYQDVRALCAQLGMMDTNTAALLHPLAWQEPTRALRARLAAIEWRNCDGRPHPNAYGQWRNPPASLTAALFDVPEVVTIPTN